MTQINCSKRHPKAANKRKKRRKKKQPKNPNPQQAPPWQPAHPPAQPGKPCPWQECVSGRRASERRGRTQPPLFPAPRRRVRAAVRSPRTRGSLFGGSRAPQRDANACPAVASTTGGCCGTSRCTFQGQRYPLARGGKLRHVCFKGHGVFTESFFSVTQSPRWSGALQAGGFCISVPDLPAKSSVSAASLQP